MSDKNTYKGCMRVCLHVEAKDPDGTLAGIRHKENDLATAQFAQLIQANILDTAETITDTGGTGRSVTANSAATVPTIAAGTTGTAATVSDTALGTETETQTTVTVNTYSGSGSSGTFTVTGTITAGSARAYQEVGLKVTVGGHVFLICHDTFSTLNVSSGGTLAVTYTLTLS